MRWAEALDDAARGQEPVELVDVLDRELRFGQVVDEEAGEAVLHRLGQAAGPPADDRRPGRHRLDRDQPERLRPRAEHQGREGACVECVTLGRTELTEELDDPFVDGGLDDLVEMLDLMRVVDLGRHPERDARSARELDRVRDALLGGHAPDEREIRAGLVAEGQLLEGQAVMDRRDPVRIGRPAPLALADRDERDRRRTPRAARASPSGRGARGASRPPASDTGARRGSPRSRGASG